MSVCVAVSCSGIQQPSLIKPLWREREGKKGDGEREQIEAGNGNQTGWRAHTLTHRNTHTQAASLSFLFPPCLLHCFSRSHDMFNSLFFPLSFVHFSSEDKGLFMCKF